MLNDKEHQNILKRAFKAQQEIDKEIEDKAILKQTSINMSKVLRDLPLEAEE